MERLTKMVDGIRNMDKLPTIIFLASARYEKTAIREAKRKNIPIIAICDSNTDPTNIDYPIPANDDAVKSVELIVGLVSQVVKESQKSGGDKKEEKKKVDIKK